MANMAVSRRELEELKSWVEETVNLRLGFSEKSVVNAALYCVTNNLDRSSSREKMTSLLDDLAPQFVTDLFEKLSEIKKSKNLVSGKSSLSRKRTLEDVFGDDNQEDRGESSHFIKSKRKQSRFDALKDDNVPLPPAMPETSDRPTPMSNRQISEMVASMKKQIEERKKQINVMKQTTIPSAQQVQVTSQFSNTNLTSAGANLIKSGLISVTAVKEDASHPRALILDQSGRTVDAAGRAIQLTSRMPTLKANIRAKKAEQFKIEKPTEDLIESKYFDARVGIKPAQRSKRGFKFHERGKFQQIAQRIRAKTQLDKLQKEIAAVAKKTGISSATKLALITPKEAQEDFVPDIEWWDGNILPEGKYISLGQENILERVMGVTALIEHPVQKHPAAEPKEAPALPIMLTKKERKKIRTQRRREIEKEKQEKIRLGLEPPPPPKVKISNLMRVLGNEAIQDPTKVEAHVRAQMAQRQKAHEAANAARKLTPEARREKTIRKLKEDTSLGVHVAVFRVTELRNPQRKYKVDINAQQLFLTGCAVLYKDVNLVIVEGGPKAIKKFKHLMLHRIKWEDEKESDDDEEEDSTSKKAVPCVLVWEGTNKERNFSDWKFKLCPMQATARQHLKKYGVEHYWDLALSESLLQNADG
ncbi:PREDICTED: U4/U6 small nuclear ribonucleoprotein Prp3-like [Acropora digitifera]|uniref:U4/U6 small nuclear ribonucleoprotein Prp3-like n=1 Tax=Acropora digitifera TaxID=70779 RepID=UPI00077AF1C7|nr:PREDICTED: U4/U6 small nuclear ribonucleoprotein Prp3-like [Acropora digitifera]